MKYSRKPDEIKDTELKKAFEHAEADYPNECCGVFTRSKGYIRCTNVHDNPTQSFAMKEWLSVAANIEDVIAIFHSHPNGLNCPTSIDMRYQIQTNLPWGIAVMNDSGYVNDCFFWGSDKIPQLIGREYRSGVNDCYSLIRDAYRVWYNILLPEFPRDSNYWDRGEMLYTDGFPQAGFYEIDIKDASAGDVLIGKVLSKKIINHGAVILDDKHILHHATGTLSRRSDLTRWARRLDICLRHSAFRGRIPPAPPNLGVFNV